MAQRVLVCVPVTAEQAGLVAEGRTMPGPLQVFTVTRDLMDTFGLQPGDEEQAEFAALLLAGLWSLREYGKRLVLIAKVNQAGLRPGAEQANGGQLLGELPAAAVEAWFADEAATPVAAAVGAIRGLSLDEAWEAPEVHDLHAHYDLLWHSVVELRKE
ncbi:MAG: hypothetical protein WBL05_00805 [Brooklawnia sp.]|uniref:DUF6912 family protein n=1 Tax=Brooklawnia sp. TaxID=2699740 RepID=UPI003C795DD7